MASQPNAWNYSTDLDFADDGDSLQDRLNQIRLRLPLLRNKPVFRTQAWTLRQIADLQMFQANPNAGYFALDIEEVSQGAGSRDRGMRTGANFCVPRSKRSFRAQQGQ